MTHLPEDLRQWIETQFFNSAPVFISAQDEGLNIIYANPAFESRFGPWQGKKCFEVYKKQGEICENCTSRFAFSNAKTGVNEQTGRDCKGRKIHYISYTIPVTGDDGRVKYLVEVSSETTRFKETEKEYRLLFEQVPCHIIIIDRAFRIQRANKRAEDMIGSLQGEYCFNALKNREAKCLECTARKTFEDGEQHTGFHVWNLPDGRTANMHVITILLKGEDDSEDRVMELAVDISRTVKLQDKLEAAHNYLESLINTSMDGIVGISKRGKVEVFNTAARSLFNIGQGQIVSLEDINTMLPKGFLARVSEERGHVYLPEAKLRRSTGEKFFGSLIGNRVRDSEQTIGTAFSVHDISQLKRLERDKIEAERMAIVGQTVAGLAHGIKNLINALDGGMYYLKSGIGNSDITRVHKGIETLARNIERIRNFSMAFLNYARFRSITPSECRLEEIIREVLESFAARAQELGIRMAFEQNAPVSNVCLDYEKLHEALTNLVGNALDAFKDIEDDRDRQVAVALSEEEGAIFIEVRDNGCGIDDEHRKRLFNKFFTTKGLEGTGLGLLMTLKIIQEHGGNISVFSKIGEGSVFRVRLLRSRLPKPVD